jgi:hypothetical protein
MKRLVPAAVAVVLVVLSGVVHGFWTGRWSAAASGDVAARLDSVALELGDWQGQKLEPDARQGEGMAGILYRRYVNRSTRSAVTVYLVCGRTGPVAVHTPDVCYGANGYQVTDLGKQSVRPAPGAAGAELEAVQVVKTKAAEQIAQRVYWTWSAAGTWQVPDNPRLAFARHPLLYKLYLIRDLSRPGEPLEDDPCVDLMRQLLPELKKALFPGT